MHAVAAPAKAEILPVESAPCQVLVRVARREIPSLVGHRAGLLELSWCRGGSKRRLRRRRPPGGRGARWPAEKKKQPATRLTLDFVRQTIGSFHRGDLDATEACGLLTVSRAHLFRLRSARLHKASGFAPQASGGDHHEAWPVEVRRFLCAFLPLQRPPNFQLVADQLATRFAFHRDRKSVAAYARAHFPDVVRQALPIPKPRRRWERSRIGELWQHDSSIHPWWKADAKQTLLLTIDDHSRKYLGATFVPTDTTWHHFEHFRRAFVRHGRPMASTPTGRPFSATSPRPTAGIPARSSSARSPRWGVSHLVAPSPQAKGKIERRFGTFQKRLLALLAFERISGYGPAQALLDHELEQQNPNVCRTTGLSPNDACAKAVAERRDAMRPCPAHSLLDLHFALHFSRRLNADQQIDFLGRSWPIGATQRHAVSVIHHPNRQFWVVSTPPKPPENRRSDVLGKYSL